LRYNAPDRHWPISDALFNTDTIKSSYQLMTMHDSVGHKLWEVPVGIIGIVAGTADAAFNVMSLGTKGALKSGVKEGIKVGVEKLTKEGAEQATEKLAKEGAEKATSSVVKTAAEGAAKKTDFIVTENGTAVPVSQKRMTEGFDNAGLPSKPTEAPGVEYVLPDGRKVRAMEPSGAAPRRASFENANGHPRRPIITRAGPGISTENSPLRIFVRSGQPTTRFQSRQTDTKTDTKGVKKGMFG
jgi:hypothetical protein